MDLSDCCEGNAKDTYFTLKLFDLIMERLEGNPVMKLIENVVMPSLETFAEMEYNGLVVDEGKLESMGLYPPDRTGKGKPSVSAPTLKLLLEHIEEELQTRE